MVEQKRLYPNHRAIAFDGVEQRVDPIELSHGEASIAQHIRASTEKHSALCARIVSLDRFFFQT